MDVSVAVATYDGKPHITQQLESIFDQTRPPDEVVIADDGSTDGTVEIIEEFAEAYPDIVTADIHRKGLGPNGNSGYSIEQTSGDLVAMADQDDVWHPRKLELQVAAFEERPDLALSCHNLLMTEADLTPISPYWEEFGFDPRECSTRSELIRRITPISCIARPSMVIPRRLVSRVVPPAPPEWFHDHHIALVAATQGPVQFITRPLLDYRQHDRNDRGGPEGGRLVDQIPTYVRNRAEVNGTPKVRAERWRAARDRITDYGSDELNGYQELILREIDDHIAYHESRMKILDDSNPRTDRLSGLFGNVAQLSYHAYSRGFRSALKDLIEIFRSKTPRAEPRMEIEKLCY